MGCRKPLKPNVDRNIAPETWITAAPQDTITTKDETGKAIHSQVGTVAYKFHLYWAGADQDGAIAGFYFAVVETLPIAPPDADGVPPLPGPKPSDYHFTARTDSVFAFSASQYTSSRQHAFFIYAVDNQGKADPTPARILFNALDNYPPLPVIEELRATGKVYVLDINHQPVASTMIRIVTDSLTRLNSFFPPRDTVPLDSRIDVRWHGEPVVAGTYVKGFSFKLDEPSFVDVDSSVRTVSYNTGRPEDRVSPGGKTFMLRAVSESGWVRETNRRFQMNFMPDTWFSGPDLSLYPDSARTKGVPINFGSPPVFPGSLLSCDSICTWPAERPDRKTFFEFYKDRYYVHAEGDTVHMNSWVLLHNGGLDPDSPFNVQVKTNDPEYPDTTVCGRLAKMLYPTGPNGSPIGFHMLMTIFKDPLGPFDAPAQSGLYPIFDPSSVFRSPLIGSYQPMRSSGAVYAVGRAEDGNGVYDKRVGNPRIIWEDVAAGHGDESEQLLQKRILKFYVNKAPFLRPGAGGFLPQPYPLDTFPTRHISLNLQGDDEDPLDPDVTPPPPIGGPTVSKVLRWNVTLFGQNPDGQDVSYPVTPSPVFTPQIQFDVPPYFLGTRYTLKVELCDCPACEITPGQGRCVTNNLSIRFPPPSLVGGPSSPEDSTRPGPSAAGKRRVSP